MGYSLVTTDYFVGDIVIPEFIDLVIPEGAMGEAIQDSSQAQMLWFLTRYQREYFEKLLGSKLADDFIANAAVASPPPFFIELHAKLFSSVDGIKISPAAHYIYYWYSRFTSSTTSKFGEVDIDFTFGKNVNNEIKLMTAWNTMVKATRSVYLWLNSQRAELKEHGYAISVDKAMLTYINRMGI